VEPKFHPFARRGELAPILDRLLASDLDKLVATVLDKHLAAFVDQHLATILDKYMAAFLDRHMDRDVAYVVGYLELAYAEPPNLHLDTVLAIQHLDSVCANRTARPSMLSK